jgi:hypothetical protein
MSGDAWRQCPAGRRAEDQAVVARVASYLLGECREQHVVGRDVTVRRFRLELAHLALRPPLLSHMNDAP